jgi:hypothetical protein
MFVEPFTQRMDAGSCATPAFENWQLPQKSETRKSRVVKSGGDENRNVVLVVFDKNKIGERGLAA